MMKKFAVSLAIAFISTVLSLIFIVIDSKFLHSTVPACVPLSRLQGPYAEQNAVTDFNRVVVVGDIHGEYTGLLEVLHAANIIESETSCLWKQDASNLLLIQMGDVVDRGAFAKESFECLQNLQMTAVSKTSKVVRLLGNHELWWLGGQTHMKNPKSDTVENVNYIISNLKKEISEEKVLGAFSLWMNGIPILFTHAGLRPAMTELILASIKDVSGATHKEGTSAAAVGGSGLLDVDAVAKYINGRVKQIVSESSGQRACQFTGPLFQAGPDRGDNRNIGGPFWTDFKVLQQAASAATAPPTFVQVVGHTIELNHVRATEAVSAIGVDAGMFIGGRAYLEISSAGHFRAFEKDSASLLKGVWKQRDLTAIQCEGGP